MSVLYSANGKEGVYTITREIAGGGFTPRFNGQVIQTAPQSCRLKYAKAIAHIHNREHLVWVDELARRFGYSQ